MSTRWLASQRNGRRNARAVSKNTQGLSAANAKSGGWKDSDLAKRKKCRPRCGRGRHRQKVGRGASREASQTRVRRPPIRPPLSRAPDKQDVRFASREGKRKCGGGVVEYLGRKWASSLLHHSTILPPRH